MDFERRILRIHEHVLADHIAPALPHAPVAYVTSYELVTYL